MSHLRQAAYRSSPPAPLRASSNSTANRSRFARANICRTGLTELSYVARMPCFSATTGIQSDFHKQRS